jgi:hypothetical protein
VACIADSLISRTPGDLGYKYQLRDKLSGGVCQRRSARVRRPSAANQPTSAKRQRQRHAVLLLGELHAWMIEQRPLNPLRQLNDKSPNIHKEW